MKRDKGFPMGMRRTMSYTMAVIIYLEYYSGIYIISPFSSW